MTICAAETSAPSSQYRSCVRGASIGAITASGTTVSPFDSRQIALVETFANQAVIAIENARLFEAEQTSKRELQESLEQQIATSQVLQIISSSPGDLQPVFDAILANAVRFCEAKFGNLFLREGDTFRAVAVHGPPTDYVEWYRREPVLHKADITNVPLGRLGHSKKVIHILDLREDQGYLEHHPRLVALVESAGARTILGVPMLKGNGLIGAMFIYRQQVRPFTDKQIELVSNFARQAVIAIENTRLLNELRESLQQQTATADVLKVISRSACAMRMTRRSFKCLAMVCASSRTVGGYPSEVRLDSTRYLFCVGALWGVPSSTGE